MDKKQAYEVLGIEPDSNERNVRRAYRALLFDLEDKGQTDAAYLFKKQQLEEAFEMCLKQAQSLGPAAPTSALDSVKADPEAVKKKLAFRLLLGIGGIAAIILGYTWFKNLSVDPGGTSPANTVGFIAAVENLKSGSRAVVFKLDDTKVDRPKHTNGVIDTDLAWRPDGSRLLFISNEGDGNFNIHRWNPTDSNVELRSQGASAKANLWFSGPDEPGIGDQALVTSGGFVFQYDQKLATIVQILPPPRKKTQGQSGDEQGTTGQIEALYKQIGISFASAKWAIGHPIIWAVMRRENDEVFVLNPLNGEVNKGMPAKLLAAKKIEFEVTPTGDAIVVLRQFQFVDTDNIPAQFLIDGKAVPPFDSAVYFIPVDTQQPQLICHSKGPNLYFGSVAKDTKPLDKLPKGNYTFAQPSVSPDGTILAFVSAGLVGESEFKGMALVAIPLKQDGKLKGIARLAIGDVSEPSFSAESDKVVYLKREAGGKRAIFTAPATGGPESKVSRGGDFSMPKFSPQKVAPKSS